MSVDNGFGCSTAVMDLGCDVVNCSYDSIAGELGSIRIFELGYSVVKNAIYEVFFIAVDRCPH